jgi:hypothetical protein
VLGKSLAGMEICDFTFSDVFIPDSSVYLRLGVLLARIGHDVAGGILENARAFPDEHVRLLFSETRTYARVLRTP